MTDTINIDSRGEVLTEVSARVVKDETGKPRLEPIPGQTARWYAVLNRHAGKGLLRVVMSRVSERRSNQQNRLLWGVVYAQFLEGLKQMALEVNEPCPFRDVEALHEAMKHRFLGLTVSKFNGQEIEIPPTTTTLTVEQFSSYVASIVQMAAAWGIYVDISEAA